MKTPTVSATLLPAHPWPPEILSSWGELGKDPCFTCLLGGGDWLKLLESLLSELWGMAAVSGSQGLFSFLCALGVPAFCLASLPLPCPPLSPLIWPLAPCSHPSQKHSVLLPSTPTLSLPLLSEPLHLSFRSQPPVVSQKPWGCKLKVTWPETLRQRRIVTEEEKSC